MVPLQTHHGAIFGWFVYLVYYVGLVSVQGVTVDVKTPAVRTRSRSWLASARDLQWIIDKVMEVLSLGRTSLRLAQRTIRSWEHGRGVHGRYP
jgi:hypothetical protein